jgi:hypothetical protein
LCFFEDAFDLFDGKRFDEKIKRAQAHAFDGGFDIRVAAHHDDQWAIRHVREPFQQVYAVSIG